jgi:hypothetical protein
VAAVSELRDEYAGQVEFVVVPAEETARRGQEIERYHLAARKHGLVAFDRSGAVVVTIAGHQFGREELLLAIAQASQP